MELKFDEVDNILSKGIYNSRAEMRVILKITCCGCYHSLSVFAVLQSVLNVYGYNLQCNTVVSTLFSCIVLWACIVPSSNAYLQWC